MKSISILFFALFAIGFFHTFAQTVDTNARFGIYYMIQEQQRIRVPQSNSGKQDSTDYQHISNELSSEVETSTSDNDSIYRDLKELEKRTVELARKLNRSTIISKTAGEYLEDAAYDEKTSIIVACVGGAVAGIIAGATIPFGGKAMIGGSISSGIVATSMGITSFVFHCKAVKKTRLAGNTLNSLY